MGSDKGDGKRVFGCEDGCQVDVEGSSCVIKPLRI